MVWLLDVDKRPDRIHQRDRQTENRLFAFWRQDPRWRISSTFDFTGPIIGSFKSRCATSYRSLIDTVALNYWIFDKIAFFAFWRQTDKQTDTEEQMDSTDALSRSRCRKRRLKNGTGKIAETKKCHFEWHCITKLWGSRHSLTLNISQTAIRHGHARECEWETLPKLSNGIVSNDLARPVTYMWRLRC